MRDFPASSSHHYVCPWQLHGHINWQSFRSCSIIETIDNKIIWRYHSYPLIVMPEWVLGDCGGAPVSHFLVVCRWNGPHSMHSLLLSSLINKLPKGSWDFRVCSSPKRYHTVLWWHNTQLFLLISYLRIVISQYHLMETSNQYIMRLGCLIFCVFSQRLLFVEDAAWEQQSVLRNPRPFDLHSSHILTMEAEAIHYETRLKDAPELFNGY